MKYFAYGSNMLTQRLEARVSLNATPETFVLRGYQLRFHKRSADCSGKCNIIKGNAERDFVHGVIFDISPSQIGQLDEAEGCGFGYRRESITPSGLADLTFTAYIADLSAIDDALIPYRWYLNLVLAGAEQHKLPHDYIAALRAIPFSSDPKADRKTKLEAEGALKAYYSAMS